jgi:hypothetical protein
MGNGLADHDALPSAAHVAAGIDHIEESRSTFEIPKRITLGRTTFMDAPFFMDEKQEETTRREEVTVLGTEAILLPSKVS